MHNSEHVKLRALFSPDRASERARGEDAEEEGRERADECALVSSKDDQGTKRDPIII